MEALLMLAWMVYGLIGNKHLHELSSIDQLKASLV